jgi:predicted transposase/invertase (TIGR01784 family)
MTIMLPKIDFAFKLLFGDLRSRNILADFLKAVLPGLADEEFAEITIEDPHLKREFGGGKLKILDMKIRTAGGKLIDIAIQISGIPEMRSRITYYLSNMITGQIGRGGHYNDLKQAISIVIADYDFIPESTQRYEEIILQMTGHGMDSKAIAAITQLSEAEISSTVLKERRHVLADDKGTANHPFIRYTK